MSRKPFPDPAMVPGVPRFDEEGNNKIYEHEMVSQYWLDHYVKDHRCILCKNRGRIDLAHIGYTAEGELIEKPYCICPNGQAMRWHKIKKLGV